MIEQLSRAGGSAFSLIFRTLKLFRPHRPIHPAGVYLAGSVVRFASDTPSGIDWVDTPGTNAVQARMSRAVGLPAAAPDILGLALRIGSGPSCADVLFASTGWTRPGRFALIPQRRVSTATFTTLMPYRGRRGGGRKTPVLLAARTVSPAEQLPAGAADFRRVLGERTWTLGLYHANPMGPWTRFGTLSLALDPEQPDTDLRFDPVLHPLDGAETYEWVRRLREPAYAAARRPAAKEPNT